MNALLNHEQIKKRKLIRRDKWDRYGIASYDLRIESIYPINSRKRLIEHDLEPQGMVLVTTREEFDLPYNTLGYTTIRNKMSNKGILAINIGLVDPGYKGPISSILINFGKDKFPLKQFDSVLRMTFHEFDEPGWKIRQVDKFDRKGYEKSRKNEVRASLESTFLNMEKMKSQIKREIFKEILQWTGGLGLIIIILSFVFDMIIGGNP